MSSTTISGTALINTVASVRLLHSGERHALTREHCEGRASHISVLRPEGLDRAAVPALSRPVWKIGGFSPRNANVQSTTPQRRGGLYQMSSTISVLTAQKVFGWTFDLNFLMQKAHHDLDLSMTEGYNSFFFNAMNFAVTIHAIVDHLWEVQAKADPRWETTKKRGFMHWIKTQNDCIPIFVDLSNTYKHSERRDPNAFADHLGVYPDQLIQHSPSPEDMGNRIVHNDPSGDVFYWPVLTKPDGRLIYYRYAAKTALDWWRKHHSSLA